MVKPKWSVVMVYSMAMILYLIPTIVCAAGQTTDSTTIEILQAKSINSLLAQDVVRSEAYFEEARQLARKNKDLKGLLDLIKAYGKTYRDSVKDAEKAIAVFRMGTEEATGLQPQTKEEWDAQASLYVNLAYMLNELGTFTEAIAPYEAALRIFDQELEEESEYTALYIYRYLGNIYTRLGEYTAAEALLLRCYKVFYNLGKNDLAAESCSDLGLLYQNWNKPDQEMEQYQKGISLVRKGSVSEALLHTNLAKLYWVTGNYDNVRNESLKAINIFQQNDPAKSYYDIHQYAATSFDLLARMASQRKEKATTLRYLDSARHRLVLEYGSENRREMGKFQCRAAESYQRLNMLDEAQLSYQQAFKSVLIDFRPEKIDDLPAPGSFYAENTIMEALVGLAQLYKAKYQQDNQQDHLKLALQCHELIHFVDQEIRRSHHYESSKLFNLEESRNRSEQGITLAQQLYELTGDEKYIYQAFIFAERNRSSLLREAYRTTQASVLAGVSDEDLSKEEALKYSISEAQEALFRLRANDKTPDHLIQLAEQQLFQSRTALDNWITELEASNPRYFQLKYADAVPGVDTLQRMLGSQQLLVEYFIGIEQLYVFTLDAKRLSLYQLPLPEALQDRIIAWRKNIQDFQYIGIDKSKLRLAYQEEAYRLFQELLLPVLGDQQHYQELLIVPNGILDLLPFEALLTQPISTPLSFQEYPYLLRDYTISYTYSASLQWSLSQLPRRGSGRIGFAPNFNGNGGWASVICSGDMLQELLRKNQDVLKRNSEATIDEFIKLAGRYRLLHLATHAQANAEQGDFSFIVFSDGQGGYDSLFVKDLYPLDIEAELVILSACETALGTIYNSEGIISLARGFHFAGARSVLTTLWSINEGANCTLMPKFYQYLDQGKSKKAALHAAKLAFLQEDERLAHPVYWAGFQLLGNPRPLNESSNGWWWLGLSALVLGLGYLTYHFRKSH
jgi:CHAT domain-containing protein